MGGCTCGVGAKPRPRPRRDEPQSNSHLPALPCKRLFHANAENGGHGFERDATVVLVQENVCCAEDFLSLANRNRGFHPQHTICLRYLSEKIATGPRKTQFGGVFNSPGWLKGSSSPPVEKQTVTEPLKLNLLEV